MTTLREQTLARARTRARGPEMDAVVDLRAVDLAMRLYQPTAKAVPLVVYLHGGGWTIGSIETHDRACRRLSVGSGCAVLSVDYRLAPEHPWPATARAGRWRRSPACASATSAGVSA